MSSLQIKLNSVLVNDQDQALKFYTDTLGFVKKNDIPMGEFRWLTVVSAEGSGEVELVLEPTAFEPAKVYQKALFEAGIPQTIFEVADIQQEFERLEKLGVLARLPATEMATRSGVQSLWRATS